MLFSDSLKLDFVGIIIAFIVIIIAKHKWTLGYWQRRGVPGPGGVFLFGSVKDFFLGKKILGECLKDFHLKFKSRGERYFGFYFSGSPIFVPIDMDLIKGVIQNHDQFDSHGFYYTENQPITLNVFFLAGIRWKQVRSKLTPVFTPAKIKMLFKSLLDCSVGLKGLLDKSSKNNPVNMRDIMSSFTIDVIGVSAFGLEMSAMKDNEEPSDLVINGNKVLEASIENSIRLTLPFIVNHNILNAFHFNAFNPDINDFYSKITNQIIKYREENNIVKNDFIDILIRMKNTKNEHERLTVSEIIGQTFIFHVAGFETTASSINLAVFEISQHQDIQDKMRQEINSVLSKYDNQLSYEAVQEMVYLDQVVYESLRKYPAVPVLLRQCNEDYKVEGTDLVIKKGTLTFISTSGIHHDPEYYPNPDKFDPERFSPENRKTRPPYSWMPFGEGPRICLGMRFAIQEMKVALITLIKNFKFSLNSKTILPLKMTRAPFLMKCDKGVYIDLERIDSGDPMVK